MAEQVLTMLFTDVEGSTLLVQRLGSRWPSVIDLHRRLCRAAWRAHDGREVDTAGDGFFVVFDSPADAVRAAVAAQLALAAADWPDDAPVRVRMGLHTGPVVPHEDSYVGYEVHRAARVAAAAHGGQVVATSLVDLGDVGDVPLTIEDLGPHRLKDLAQPERLLQLSTPGLQTEFPALRALATDFPATSRNPLEVLPGRLTSTSGVVVPVTGYGVRVGRTPDNDLVLADGDVSRHHCVITATDGGFVLTDLQSTNGTHLNGAGLTTPRLLADQDVIGLGATELRFTWPA